MAREEYQTRKIVLKLAKHVPWYKKAKSWFGFGSNRKHIRDKYFNDQNYKQNINIIAKLYNDLGFGKQSGGVSEKDFYSYLYEHRNEFVFVNERKVDPVKLRRDLLLYAWSKNKDFKAVYEEAGRQGDQGTLIDNFLALYNVTKRKPIDFIKKLKQCCNENYIVKSGEKLWNENKHDSELTNKEIAVIFGYDIVDYLKIKYNEYASLLSGLNVCDIENVRARFIEQAFHNLTNEWNKDMPSNFCFENKVFIPFLYISPGMPIADSFASEHTFGNPKFCSCFDIISNGKLTDLNSDISNYSYNFDENSGFYTKTKCEKPKESVGPDDFYNFVCCVYQEQEERSITDADRNSVCTLSFLLARRNGLIQGSGIPLKLGGLFAVQIIRKEVETKKEIEIKVNVLPNDLFREIDRHSKNQEQKESLLNKFLDGLEKGKYEVSGSFADFVRKLNDRYGSLPVVVDFCVETSSKLALDKIHINNFMQNGFAEVLKLRDLAVKSGKGSADERVFNAVCNKLKDKFASNEPSNKILDTLKKSVEVMNNCESPNNKSNLSNGGRSVIENEKQVCD